MKHELSFRDRRSTFNVALEKFIIQIDARHSGDGFIPSTVIL